MSDSNVLGQRTRPTNIDYGLADRINAEVAEEKRKAELETRRKPKPCPEDSPVIRPAVINEKNVRYKLDEWDDIRQKAQVHWIWHFNNSLSPYVMMSAGDLYGITKQIRRDLSQGSVEQKKEAQTMIDNLTVSFERHRCGFPLLLSTRTSYWINKNAYRESMITHHFKSQDEHLIKQYTVEIHPYHNQTIEKTLSEANGECLMQALFDTNDNPADIISNLKFIARSAPNNIRLIVPEPNSWDDPIKRQKDRVSSIGYKTGMSGKRFEICLDEMPSTEGCCRGVIIEEEEGTK